MQPEQVTPSAIASAPRPVYGPDFQIADLLFPNGMNGNLLLLRRKEMLFRQDTTADAAFYLQEGRIKLRVASAGGRIATVSLMGPGELLGEECLASKLSLRPATAIAVSDCTIVRLDRLFLEQLFRSEPGFQEFFLDLVLARNRRMQQDLMAHLSYSGEKRLARLLLLIAGLDDCAQDEKVIPRINQDELAEVVGTTRARVSYFMNRFRDKGFVDYNGELTVRRSLLEVIL
ncbi:MAG: Crp/Fnr family transcriptional regulator [Terriglobales bacterium]